MKTKSTSVTEGSRNTFAATMALASRVISEANLSTLRRIELDLETGLRQHKLDQHDAGKLLGQVRCEIADRSLH